MAADHASAPRPYYEDESVTIYHGDCRDLVPSLTADAVFADPPYGVDKAAWDSSFNQHWMALIPPMSPILAVTPGNRNLASLPNAIGDLLYRWTLSAVITNATVRGDLGFGNWIPVLLYARHGVSLYGPRQDVKVLAIRGEMPNHPSPKPIAVMRWVLSCLPGNLVLDPFLRERAQRFLASVGDLRDSDGFCLSCNSWVEHRDDCAFQALKSDSAKER